MKFRFTRDLSINDSLRKELSKPFGRIMKIPKLVKTVGRKETIYAVGDVTVSELLKHGYIPKIAVFDYMNERSNRYFGIIRKMYKKPMKAENKRGGISADLWNAVAKAARSKGGVGIRVYGEEDMASLACIHFAKRGEILMYGMRNRGVAVITIDGSIKKYVENVLLRMKRASG